MMFFIGIFGVEEKAKVLKQKEVDVCPFCTRKGSYTFFKVYNYFHFFFIPIFRWNTRYFLQTNCCSRIYLITNKDVAFDIEHGKDVDISFYDVELFKDMQSMHDTTSEFGVEFCPNCKNRVSKSFLYCPYCGQKL